MITKNVLLDITDIKKAKEILDVNARKTPLVKSFYLTSKTGGEIYLKLENMQLTGSFKFRGAFNKISQLTNEEKERGVIACSAGNHAQGVALSSHLLGIKSKIVMPISAPQAKVDATRGYGSEVILYGDTFDDAKAKCEEIIKETGETYLHPYDDVEVMAGQGTIGLDILDDMWDVDTVIVPIGGGGIISGIAVALKSFNPSINIIGVQADNVHGMKASYDAGRILEHYEAPTIADGCAVKIPGNLTFEIVKDLVDEIVTVSEEELEVAMKDLLQRGKAVVEGAGALATAALLAGKVDKYVQGKKVVAVISGGNVDLKRISTVCEHFFVANEVK
ncbi:bifunctional threonine ammonia-lyase/L-serine ammonia-lyase TdcB (plasmid) [Bacillus cereus]|uniref:L-threonine dehydratase catabolic TdcB n=1 Tax=Bacillus thuringiensis serovar kumamotoensis TaxID=132267 RepID=A0A9X6PNE0_BACUK|nr:bifunctional threonine ammonia-lyase/L-serine ammonia-lyase TdcB [Bacillus thuringiensis]MCU5691561.1 bifunctional threonine ammonia-lyase/L-serine ammonia-lyase TdcB [Bacillus cereus]MDA2253293.1 bifunctional threonine ammonia-lyase/L-serine ammonia-lyase TdcB [Bacillus cereus]MDA2281159.1 bifunctional threonine ammonia-lyase/L-serine ammonia-lyase TdcB [Bacillus cereus]MDA2694443.1 bifunctional threonine ammonia-lyase/L-serine ammonia-lyase TdcB [Bacillus cereus]MDA2700093.1 bifunctional 